jgi:hypothetical protein
MTSKKDRKKSKNKREIKIGRRGGGEIESKREKESYI